MKRIISIIITILVALSVVTSAYASESVDYMLYDGDRELSKKDSDAVKLSVTRVGPNDGDVVLGLTETITKDGDGQDDYVIIWEETEELTDVAYLLEDVYTLVYDGQYENTFYGKNDYPVRIAIEGRNSGNLGCVLLFGSDGTIIDDPRVAHGYIDVDGVPIITLSTAFYESTIGQTLYAKVYLADMESSYWK